MKSGDPPETNGSEGVPQVRPRRSRTKVGGSKTIRYRCSPDGKRCHRKGGNSLTRAFSSFNAKAMRRRVPGGVRSQGWNLKELTEAHHKGWNLRLNSTQLGEAHRVRTRRGSTDRRVFRDSVRGGAWPFLVGGSICLVYSVNERDPRQDNSDHQGFWCLRVPPDWYYYQGQRPIRPRKGGTITGLWCP